MRDALTASSAESTPSLPPRYARTAGPRVEAAALRRAYLDLLKLCLVDLVGANTQTVSWTGDRRVFYRELEGTDQLEWRIDGRDWPLSALTMTGLRRLDNLQACVESIVGDGIEGDLIEAGAWRGGSSILMRATLDVLGADDRIVWIADSFQGFPAPETGGAEEDQELEGDMSALAYLAPGLEQVKGNFARFGLDHGVNFVPGFFEDTMSGLRGEQWSLVRLDADTYKATRLTLETLYPGLALGGYLVSDDYAFLPACRRAIDEFRAEHGITEPIEQIDYNAVRWRREEPGPPTSQTQDAGAQRAIAPVPRAVVKPTVTRIPSDRELELRDKLASVQSRLREVEAEIESLQRSPIAGPAAWASRRLRRG